LRSPISQADKPYVVGTLEKVDGFAGLRNGLRQIAKDRDVWAGIPMPLDGEQLVIHPRYPFATEMMAICAKTDEKETNESDDIKIRNQFWSDRLKAEVYIWQADNGKIVATVDHKPHHISLDLHTLGCSQAWGIEQEHNAIQLLGTLLRHHQFKQYLLTGMFLERSERSGLSYMFRRLKPTVVLDARDKDAASTRILACLCMHPISYYQGTWAGGMCPTDDVVAHLMMMRGDEHLFWKRSNQHHPLRPEAGL
jgi:hypothetical protein